MPIWFTWSVIALAVAGVILRPLRLPEAIFALAGAAVLLLTGVLSLSEAWKAVLSGADVYLFLTGMMLVSEIARRTGLFDYLAMHAARRANGSPQRLLALVYGVGVGVTALMSNDATAVVLTPAVLAATRAARVRFPLPYLYACAFVANAASFLLPIANPANLVVFQERMPSLLHWLGRFLLPSLLAIGVTYGALCFTQRRVLRDESPASADALPATPELTPLARWAIAGIAALVVVMLTASACGAALGAPTAVCGIAVLAVVAFVAQRMRRRNHADGSADADDSATADPSRDFGVMPVLRGVSWGVLPLVAGLFMLVAALGGTGELAALARWLQHVEALARSDGTGMVSAWSMSVGVAAGLLGNLVNNLPAGLIAGQVLAQAHAAAPTLSGALIGIDLGPNLSVSGSLATMLWLVALRRENIDCSAGAFLRVGVIVMVPALLAALAGMALQDALVAWLG